MASHPCPLLAGSHVPSVRLSSDVELVVAVLQGSRAGVPKRVALEGEVWRTGVASAQAPPPFSRHVWPCTPCTEQPNNRQLPPKRTVRACGRTWGKRSNQRSRNSRASRAVRASPAVRWGGLGAQHVHAVQAECLQAAATAQQPAGRHHRVSMQQGACSQAALPPSPGTHPRARRCWCRTMRSPQTRGTARTKGSAGSGRQDV